MASDDRALLPIYALAAHGLGDWPLQTDQMAAAKLDNRQVRAKHVAVYTISFLPVVMAANWRRRGTVAFLVTLAGSHYVIDSQRWKDDTDEFPTFAIWYDQVLHLIALALAMGLGEVVGGE